MSEAEKKRRLEYKQNRIKWLQIGALVLAGLILLTLVSTIVFIQANKATYISYAEKGEMDYTVLLKDNDFYDKGYAEDDKAYVASLIDKIAATVKYELLMDAKKVDFEYSYSVDALLEVKDANTGAVIFDKTDALVPKKTVSKSGNALVIREDVIVDFHKYNDLAKSFIEAYKLTDTESTLQLKLRLDVIGDCEEFGDASSNSYTAALSVPLTENTVNITRIGDIEQGDNSILACKNMILKNVFMVLSIVLACLTVLDAAALVVFIYITRNTDINYEIKVNKILKSYRSFIQQISNPFDTEGYQLLAVTTFGEMLEIRDTIQSPILMNENEDKTSTLFVIPTNTKLLYTYEVRVEDYDEIYAAEEPEEPEELVVVLEDVPEEEVAEAMSTPDIDLDEIDFEDTVDEETEDGVEVINVVWPEKEKKNKLYRYDPNGEQVHDGDTVLVPSRDVKQNKDIIRKAAVVHGNHRVDPATIHHPLKKIIAVVKRKAEEALSGKGEENN